MNLQTSININYFSPKIFEELKKHYSKIDCRNAAIKKRKALERRINAGFKGWQTRIEKKDLRR